MLLSDDDLISEARDAFQLAADAEAENRREALDDLKFARLGQQWPEAVLRAREREGRPGLPINLFVGQTEQGTDTENSITKGKTSGFKISGSVSGKL
jgi:hypothetical protein